MHESSAAAWLMWEAPGWPWALPPAALLLFCSPSPRLQGQATNRTGTKYLGGPGEVFHSQAFIFGRVCCLLCSLPPCRQRGAGWERCGSCRVPEPQRCPAACLPSASAVTHPALQGSCTTGRRGQTRRICGLGRGASDTDLPAE